MTGRGVGTFAGFAPRSVTIRSSIGATASAAYPISTMRTTPLRSMTKSAGKARRHTGHQVAQKSTATTDPRNSARLWERPCASCNWNAGAGAPMRTGAARTLAAASTRLRRKGTKQRTRIGLH